MDDPRGITLGNSKTWRGDTYTAVAEMTAGSCKGCCYDNNETCTLFGKYIIIKKS